MIEIINFSHQRINKNFLIKIIERVLKKEKEKKKEILLILAGEKRIRLLNKKYRGENRVTDVLAFPQPKEALFKNIPEFQSLGEIIICPTRVKENAKKFHTSFKRELARVLVHGVLHLLGYDHEKNKKGAEKMFKKQEKYLKELFK